MLRNVKLFLNSQRTNEFKAGGEFYWLLCTFAHSHTHNSSNCWRGGQNYLVLSTQPPSSASSNISLLFLVTYLLLTRFLAVLVFAYVLLGNAGIFVVPLKMPMVEEACPAAVGKTSKSEWWIFFAHGGVFEVRAGSRSPWNNWSFCLKDAAL